MMKFETTENLEQQDAIAATSLDYIDEMFDRYEEELNDFLTTFGGITYHDLYSTISDAVETFCLEMEKEFGLDAWMVMDDLNRYMVEGRIYVDKDHALYKYVRDFMEMWEEV